MSRRFEGRVAVVTGSGQSIGFSIARLLASEGARVVLNSRTERSLDATPTAADALRTITAEGGDAIAVFADVATMAGAASVVSAATGKWGRIDILVNNAGGGGETRRLEDLDERDWDGLLAANLKSQFACIRAALPTMRTVRYGRILNIGSPIGLYGMAGFGPYCAAKAGVMGLTFSLAHEVASEGITVNCLMPSAATERNDRSRAAREAVTGVRVARTAERVPEAIAAPAAQLLMEASGGISGQLFEVSGGRIRHFVWPPSQRTLQTDGFWSLERLGPGFAREFGYSLPPVGYPG